MWTTRRVCSVSLLGLLAVCTATNATSTLTGEDTTGPPGPERLAYQLDNESGELLTVSESAESVQVEIGEPESLVLDPNYPALCYNDAVDCANRVKDFCRDHRGIRVQTFDSRLEKCSVTCNDGTAMNCTKNSGGKA